MLFRAAFLSAVALLGAHQAIGAALETRGELIATDAYYACNCPNNCSHKEGSSCKYYSGPSDTSTVLKGKCQYDDSDLECIAQS